MTLCLFSQWIDLDMPAGFPPPQRIIVSSDFFKSENKGPV